MSVIFSAYPVFSSNMISENLTDIFSTFTNLITNTTTLIGMTFLALLFGLYALFLGLLRFAFNRRGTFNEKEIKVISFMISFIGTSGFMFMFKNNPAMFIVFFGGLVGLFLVVAIALAILVYFYKLSKKLKDETEYEVSLKGFDKALYWTYIVLGLFFSVGLVLGYTHMVLAQASCIDSMGNYVTSCQGFSLFGKIYEFASYVFSWVLTIGLFVGLWFIFSRLGRGFKDRSDVLAKNEELRMSKNLITDINNKVKEIDKIMKEQRRIFR